MNLFFKTLHFMNSKHRSSLFDENLESELRCALSVTYTLDFKDRMKKGCEAILLTHFYI